MELTQEELRRKWVEALRSGEYRQGQKCLRTRDNSFCCLGVLCDVALKHDATIGEWREGPVCWSFASGFGSATSGLTDEVAKAAGVKDTLGVYGDSRENLAYDNDGGKTFAEIADIIESKPAGLFVNDGGGTHV